MIALPDTSFLCAIYRKQDNSQTAAAYAATMKEPLHVTTLLSYEFRQSLRLQVWRHTHHPKEGMPLADAQAALNQFEADLANGVAVLIPCNFQDVFRRSDELSARHTMSSGHRAFDVLHVATGMNTDALVGEAVKLKNKALRDCQPYNEVWCVFDRDSFPLTSYDRAFQLIRANGIKAAWANEAFEIWYLLHFNYHDTGISRDE